MAETYFIRHSKERNYTVLDNTFLKDPELSWKAKGVFAYILSLPEDWKIYLTELQTHAIDGETSLRSAIKELSEKGYIRQTRVKDEKGRWQSYAYEIIEKPLVGNRDVGIPDVVNHALLNTKDNKYSKEKNTLSKDNVTQKPLIPSKSKKTKKAQDIDTMKKMILAFTQNENIREKLNEYFRIRLKKGLEPNQWSIILEDLRKYAGDNANLATEKINGAIAGGYMQIIAAWEKDKAKNVGKSKFDNTAGSDSKAVVNMTDEEREKFEEDLVKDESGNLVQF